jgi:type VI secretion system protein ImpA
LPIQRALLARMPAPSTQGFTSAMIGQACNPLPEWSGDDEATLAAQVESGQTSATQARLVRPIREGARTLRLFMRTLSSDARAADAAADVTFDDPGMDENALRRVALGLRDQVVAARKQLQLMSDTLYDINAIYDARTGDSASLAPVLSLLRATVGDCDRFLAIFPESEAVATGGTEAAESDAAPTEAAAAGVAARPKGFVVTTPQSRADVVTALDAVVRFFEQNEPTSPVPLMLKRVRTWVEMDFLQLLREIAPVAVDDAQTLLMVREE